MTGLGLLAQHPGSPTPTSSFVKFVLQGRDRWGNTLVYRHERMTERGGRTWRQDTRLCRRERGRVGMLINAVRDQGKSEDPSDHSDHRARLDI